MVEEETRRYRPTKNYLENVLPATTLMTAFETPLMKAEFDRVASRSPMDTLSMKRYELPTPPAAKLSDVAAWNECVDNSMAQLEHQRTRITNLELMSEFGTEAWRIAFGFGAILRKEKKEAWALGGIMGKKIHKGLALCFRASYSLPENVKQNSEILR